MKKVILLSFIAWSIMSAALAEDRDRLLADCATIDACLAALDPAIPEKDGGQYEDDIDAIRIILKGRFGDAAKYALLEKARGPDSRWRVFSSAVLSRWGDWRDEDVPLLREALRLEPRGWIALVLGEIASPAAIEALAEALPYAGFFSATGTVLMDMGPDVVGYLLPALEVPSLDDLGEENWLDYGGWHSAAELIGYFQSKAVFIADDWIKIAKNRRNEPLQRIAALRGLAALNGYLDDKSRLLRPIRRDRNKEIAKQAFDTLVEAHDVSVVEELAAACQPAGEKFDPYVFDSRNCLRQLSEFGSNARAAGPRILAFLNSENSTEQAYAIETLGLIGFHEAIPQIETFLKSDDWRHVYAAIRALGQLGARDSIAKIEEATRDHWMWELRRNGGHASTLLLRRQPYSELYPANTGFMIFGIFGNYSALVDYSNECAWGVWFYKGERLEFEDAAYVQETIIELPDGKLVGTDKGEFGGALEWRPSAGETIVLVPDNASHIFRVSNGYLSLHGIAHMGTDYSFAVLLTRGDDGAWRAEEVARFPKDVDQIKRLEGDLFAANAGGRVVVFSPAGIIDTASCDWQARPVLQEE